MGSGVGGTLLHGRERIADSVTAKQVVAALMPGLRRINERHAPVPDHPIERRHGDAELAADDRRGDQRFVSFAHTTSVARCRDIVTPSYSDGVIE